MGFFRKKMTIKKIVKMFHSQANLREELDEYCRKEYKGVFPAEGYFSYGGYEILSETELSIKYVYPGGTGDFIRELK